MNEFSYLYVLSEMFNIFELSGGACMSLYLEINFTSGQELDHIKKKAIMRNPRELARNSCAIGGGSLGYITLFPLTSTAFFSLYLDLSSLLPIPFLLV